MNNRLLSLLIIVVIFGGLFGVYYYFFIANVGTVSFVINGSGSTRVELVSEFRNTYAADCEKLCTFEKIPPVAYSVRASRNGYTTLEKTFSLGRGDSKKMVLALEKEVALIEQKQKKEETIATLKLTKSISDTLESTTGSAILGRRPEWLYFAVPTDAGWMISRKTQTEEGAKELFPLPKGTLSSKSLDIYEWYLALGQEGGYTFYSLRDGAETPLSFDAPIIAIKDTGDRDTKIITTETGVYTYSVSDKTSRENPLYDDIILLPTGKIVALVRKTSTKKRSILSLPASGKDYILLIGSNTRERKILLQTEKNGKILRYRDGEIIFTNDAGENLVIENVE